MTNNGVRTKSVDLSSVRPDTMRLIGDRYLIELEEIDNLHHFEGSDIPIELPSDSLDEKELGWFVGRVVATGGIPLADAPKEVEDEYDGVCGTVAHRLTENTWVPMFCKVGDLVVCERFGGARMVLGGRKYSKVPQAYIVGIVE